VDVIRLMRNMFSFTYQLRFFNINLILAKKLKKDKICNSAYQLGSPFPLTSRQKQLEESERVSEKVGLKLNIQKTKIMVSGPITSWEVDAETVETVSNFS